MRGTSDAVISFIVVCCLMSAVLGWAVIEFIIWVFSHITFDF